VEEGLSNNAVICSVQDQRGFLWLGTKDGLNRFDGYNFKVFRHHPGDPGSIGSNAFNALYEDPHGILWVGTERGVYQYDPETEGFSRLDVSPVEEVRDIKMDQKGNLWFIAGLELYRYHPATGKLTPFPPGQFFEATSLCVAATGKLWVATTNGLLECFDAATRSFESFDVFKNSEPAVSRWIEKIFDTGVGSLLIGTSNQGVKLFDLNSESYRDILTYNADKTAIFARAFLHNEADEYWIGTESGIFIYHLRTGKIQNLVKQNNNPYSLSDNAVYTFCKDKEGGIWAGTYFGGLNYYARPYVSFEKFLPQVGRNSLGGSAVREIHPDAYGNLWIGTEDGGLSKLALASRRFTRFKPDGTAGGIANRNIHGLLVTGDTLWIGTFEHGLDLMDISTGRVIRHYNAGPDPGSLRSNFIYCIYRTRSGDILMGTGRGLYHYQPATDRFRPVPGFSELFYTAIYEDSKGIIWAGTYRSGLYWFNPRTGGKGSFLYDPGQPTSLSSNRINRILEDSGGHMWFATEGGLCRLNADGRGFSRYDTENGFPSNLVFAMLEDRQKNLWVSTSKGLVCFNMPTAGMKVYTKDNGLLSDQFNYNSAYKDSSGRMYFGSVGGLISFNPQEFIQNTYAPPVYITGFQVYNNELEIGRKGSPLKSSIILADSLVLTHAQSSFSIDFAALGYSAPGMTEYAYLMEGLDEQWTYLKTNRKAFFTKLSPGDYVFRVKAANSSGVWNEKEARLHIRVLPPFWGSTLAYLMYGCIFTGVCWYGIRRYRLNVRKRNMRNLERLEHEKEKEIYHAKIEFFTHLAHEIRTPLTLIKGPMEKIIKKADAVPQIQRNLKIMERNTERLLALASQLLDFRKTETAGFSLNFVKTDISQLLKSNILNFRSAAEAKHIHVKLDVPEPHLCAYIDIAAFNKILTNLLDNAIKYADSKVQVCLSVSADPEATFMIRVKNDGYSIPSAMSEKIFEPFFRIKDGQQKPGTGIGLPLSRSLAMLHKGRLELEDTKEGLNVFVLILPVHHQIEFNPVMG
jgi:ligand-binding sensor domain-containing protein/signal transduction histidine kinase